MAVLTSDERAKNRKAAEGKKKKKKKSSSFLDTIRKLLPGQAASDLIGKATGDVKKSTRGSILKRLKKKGKKK